MQGSLARRTLLIGERGPAPTSSGAAWTAAAHALKVQVRRCTCAAALDRRSQPCRLSLAPLAPVISRRYARKQQRAPLTCAANKDAKRSAGAPSGQAAGPGKGKRLQEAQAKADDEEEEEEEEDGYLDEDGDDYEAEEGEEGYGEDGEDEEDEDGDRDDGDYAASFLEPDDAPREVASGGTSWGEAVLAATRDVLAQPAMRGLELYLFRALPASRKVDIRLDKLDDVYGSPSIDDIERFQRALMAALEREMGPEAAGEISFEVSSPGAERLVAVPDELSRFGGLPLQVEYSGPDGRAVSAVLLLESLDVAGGASGWRLANVRANATVKGRALSKKQLAAVTAIPLASISRVRIHVDF